jgi:alpha-beta hydrolase superfamily lysophospholipase
MAGEALPQVRAPVLLVVGGLDYTVLELNEDAAAKLTCENRVEIVPGATHLFEEPGTLDRVIELAADWFATHFSAAAPG